MTDKQNPKDDDDDFDFSDPVLSNDFNFDLTEEDIRAANNMRENIITPRNTINEKEVERRAIAQAQYKEFENMIEQMGDAHDLNNSHQIFYSLAFNFEITNARTFWAYDNVDDLDVMDKIKYCTWVQLEISNSEIDDRLKVLIMSLINSYIGELVYGKLAWKIALSL